MESALLVFGEIRTKDPRGSNTKAGQTNYDDLYADILLWMKKGWVDYVAPQLYWEIGHKLADYAGTDRLVEQSQLWPAYLYWAWYLQSYEKNAAWKNPNELPDQIKLLREYPECTGKHLFQQ